VIIVRATKKLLDRVGPPTLRDGEESTTILGQWYAAALFWKALRRLDRQRKDTATRPDAVGTGDHIAEQSRSRDCHGTRCPQNAASPHRCGTTADGRPTHRHDRQSQRRRDHERLLVPCRRIPCLWQPELLDISLRLATTPCSPLYKKNISPDRELAALMRSFPDLSTPGSET
jgi:hypothetical protein